MAGEPMEPMIRGYSLPIAARVILGDPEIRPRLPQDAVDHLEVLTTSKPDLWVPRQEGIRLWKIVDEASLDGASAYNNIVRCGEAIADQALSTFLKLLLRVLSPSQFARKFPDIWSHEHKGGFVDAVLNDDKTMVIQIHDVEGFLHVGPISVGFVGTALRALGLKDLKVQDVTWTRERPAERDVRIEISWR